MGMAVAAHGQSFWKPMQRTLQHLSERLHFQKVADDKEGERPVVALHPFEHLLPSGKEGPRKTVRRAVVGFLAPSWMALVLRQVPEIVGVDREPSGHVRPPAQGQQDGGGAVRCVR